MQQTLDSPGTIIIVVFGLAALFLAVVWLGKRQKKEAEPSSGAAANESLPASPALSPQRAQEPQVHVVGRDPYGNVGAQIYRSNAFGVCGLRTSITPNELRMIVQSFRLQARVQIGKLVPCGPLSGFTEFPVSVILEYADRLTHPENRVVDEVFWLWPLDWDNEGKDEGLEAVDHGDLSSARKCWTAARHDRASHLCAEHNLAVLDHLIALDRDLEGNLWQRAAILTADIDGNLVAAVKRWVALFKNEAFISLIVGRLVKCGSQVDTQSFVEDMRNRLPMMLVKPFADAAASRRTFPDAGDCSERRRHFESGGIASEAVALAYSSAAEPLKIQIRTIADRAENNAPASKEQLLKAAAELLASTEPLLQRVRFLLGGKDATYGELSDRVAETGLTILIEAREANTSWEQIAALLQQFFNIAQGTLARSRLEGNLDVAKANRDGQSPFENLEPIGSAPSLYTLNGIGTRVYGRHAYDARTDTYVTTHFFTVFFYPLIPLGRYRVQDAGGGSYRFYGKLPVQSADWVWPAIAALALVFLSSMGSCSSSTYTYTTPSSTGTTAQTRSSPTSNGAVNSIQEYLLHSLDTGITNGKLRLASYEASLARLKTQGEGMTRRLQLLAEQIASFETELKRGDNANYSVYEATIDHHNLLIDSIEGVRSRYNIVYDDYDSLFSKVSSQIARYNELIGK